MQADVIQSDLAKEFGRMDAAFLLTVKRYLPVVRELQEKFSAEQIKKLALDLPYDYEAACIVAPGGIKLSKNSADSFRKWIENVARPTILIVYCAAASQHAISKLLTEVFRLTEQKAVLVKQAKELLKLSLELQANLLHASLSMGSNDQVEEIRKIDENV